MWPKGYLAESQNETSKSVKEISKILVKTKLLATVSGNFTFIIHNVLPSNLSPYPNRTLVNFLSQNSQKSTRQKFKANIFFDTARFTLSKS